MMCNLVKLNERQENEIYFLLYSLFNYYYSYSISVGTYMNEVQQRLA